MIRQIWTVRSRYRLFIGLSFAVTAVIFCYSALSVTVLPDQIPWGDATRSRWMLLCIPAVSLLLDTLFSVPSRHCKEAIRGMLTGCCFSGSLFGAFLQLRYLNIAKGIPHFSDIVLWLAALGFVASIIYFGILWIRSRKEDA